VLAGITLPPAAPTPTPVNGVCGSANNTNVSSAPTSGLCSTGSASSVTGSGPWSWSCAGSNGGTTATCSAQTTQSQTTNFALVVTVAGNGSVASTPTGISCGTTCSANFQSNTSVALVATPATGYIFSGWNGACTGTGTCAVSMTAARSVGATFVAQTSNPTPVSGDNLIEEPGFETSLSNFEPNQGGTSVNVTNINPISGSRSLSVGITGYGDSILWAGKDLSNFITKRSSQFSGSIKIRPTSSTFIIGDSVKTINPTNVYSSASTN
jgi:hypothetical protein